MVNFTNAEQVAQRVTTALGDRSVNWLATEAAIPRPTLTRRLKDGDFTASQLLRVARVLGLKPASFFKDAA